MTDELSDAAAIEAADKKYVMRPWTHPAGEPVIVAKASRLHDHRQGAARSMASTSPRATSSMNAGHCHPQIIEMPRPSR